MSEHKATINWKRETPDFTPDSHSRDHDWSFDGGAALKASSAPVSKGNPSCVDPGEALVASISGCHLITFLDVAARKGLVVDDYADEAVGVVEQNGEGRLALTRVTLRPSVRFSGDNIPDADEVKHLHDQTRKLCIIANSVKTDITIEPQ